MAVINYSKLKALIIEDFANFSSALRGMLNQFGLDDVDIASDGEKALPLLMNNSYDIVLSDYNLGEGRNGNDLLEEAKISKLLRSDTIYIMITAENATDMVRGALEYQPDEYLTKPFPKEVLQARLDRLLTRREALKLVYKAIDGGKLADAVKLCVSLAPKNPRYKSYLLKLRTELMMDLGGYKQATDTYQQVLEAKMIPWAQLGLGKSYYYQEMYQEAEQAFKVLLEADSGYVQAWDWLSRCQEKMGDKQAAKDSLVQAAKISPINVRRQSKLGELSMETGDLEQAERALSKSVKIGKHSINQKPESYLKLVEVVSERVNEVDGIKAKHMEQKAMSAMEDLRKVYRGDQGVQLQSHLASQKLYKAQGKEAEAENALSQALDICKNDQLGEISGLVKEQLVTALEQADQKGQAGEVVTMMQQEECHENAEAVKLYDEGRIPEALKVLRTAVERKPRSFAINLNLAQVAMHYMIKSKLVPELMTQVGQALERVQELPESDKRFKLYQDLKARYQKLKQKAQG